MLYIIMTTPICNLSCRYCGGSLHGMPDTITYEIDDLKNFIKNDDDSIIAFYGGEPLLEPGMIKEFVTQLPAKHFVINSNGYFIKDIESILHRFDSILLSIDGRKQVTDYYRMGGCYQKVLEAVDLIKQSKFRGELIARMSVSKQSDIYEDVMHLLEFFPYVHWQLDMVWSSLWELNEFKSWAELSYLPGLKKLVSYWIKRIDEGMILGIVPFLGIMSRLLHGGKGLPCQSGIESVTITTDGTILACPIAPEYSWNKLGSIYDTFHTIQVHEPCIQCDIYDICGGRCLFAHNERLWGEDGFDMMCYVTKFLINELKKHKDKCVIHKDKFFYPPYNNTTEIIP